MGYDYTPPAAHERSELPKILKYETHFLNQTRFAMYSLACQKQMNHPSRIRSLFWSFNDGSDAVAGCSEVSILIFLPESGAENRFWSSRFFLEWKTISSLKTASQITKKSRKHHVKLRILELNVNFYRIERYQWVTALAVLLDCIYNVQASAKAVKWASGK